MKKFPSIVTHCQLENGGKGIWSLTRSAVQASHIKASLKIDDVYIIHGYFQFLLHVWLSDGITDEDQEWEWSTSILVLDASFKKKKRKSGREL